MQQLVLLLTIVFSTWSCFSADKNALKDRVWRIEQLKFHGAADWVSLPGVYRLTFASDHEATISLDVNTCFGEVHMGNRSIDLSLTACTEACCDSDIALQMLASLNRVEQYTIKGDTLRLIGTDTILAFPLR